MAVRGVLSMLCLQAISNGFHGSKAASQLKMGLVAYAQFSSGGSSSSAQSIEVAAVTFRVAPCGTAVSVRLQCVPAQAASGAVEDNADSGTALAATAAGLEDFDVISAAAIAALRPPKVTAATRQAAAECGAALQAKAEQVAKAVTPVATISGLRDIKPAGPLSAKRNVTRDKPPVQCSANQASGWKGAKGGPGFAHEVFAEAPAKRLCSRKELKEMQNSVNNMRTAANKRRI